MTTGYQIVAAGTRAELVDAVNDELDDGWVLIGGPVIFPAGEDIYFYQAMKMESEDEEEPDTLSEKQPGACPT